MILLSFLIALMIAVALAAVLWPLRSSRWWIKGSVLLVFPALVLILYFHWGALNQLERYWVLKKEAVVVKATMEGIKTPDEVIDQLRAHLKKEPKSAQGWYLLGRLYMDTQQYEKAEASLFAAYNLKPESDRYMVAYAQAMFMHHDQRLSPRMRVALWKFSQRSPHNVLVINMLAIDAYRHQRYQKAIDYWEQLIPEFPEESRDRTALLKMISQAQEKLKDETHATQEK